MKTDSTILEGQRATIIPGEYGTTAIVGGPTRPEPTRAEREAARQADQIGYSQVCKRYNFSRDDFDFAKGLGFPSPLGFDLRRGNEPHYSREQIEAWAERLRAFAAKLK
jgi:hypothetical protein